MLGKQTRCNCCCSVNKHEPERGSSNHFILTPSPSPHLAKTHGLTSVQQSSARTYAHATLMYAHVHSD
jgi:hypothetical protein